MDTRDVKYLDTSERTKGDHKIISRYQKSKEEKNVAVKGDRKLRAIF